MRHRQKRCWNAHALLAFDKSSAYIQRYVRKLCGGREKGILKPSSQLSVEYVIGHIHAWRHNIFF